MRFAQVTVLALVLIGASFAFAAPVVGADGSSGCGPSQSGTMTIAKGSIVTCSASKIPGLSVKWTSSGFSPSSSTRLNQQFKATTLGSAWIKEVLSYNGTYTKTFRYKIVIKEGPPLAWDTMSARWVGSNPNEHKVRLTSKKVSGASSYRWDLGDGRVKWGREVTHTYSSARKVSTKLTVKFNDGARSSRSWSIYSNAAVAFAPQLVFYPDEKYLPGSASDFLSNSTLKWNRGGCVDRKLTWSPAASKLGSGHWSSTAFNGCLKSGDTKYRTNQKTRPYDSIVKNDAFQGFYLDLRKGDAYRKGGLGRALAYYNKWDGGLKIRYWFFYPYNEYSPYGYVSQQHEGDWETIEVWLNERMRLTNVVYAAHGCGRKIPADAVKKIDASHPVVYVAKGSHASYFTTGKFGGPCQEGKDKFLGSSTKWNTWKGGDLRDITKQSWYGYGGGWGEVGQFPFTTGPVAPPYAKVPIR